MKKFKFSLQRILDYRESIYDKEKNILAEIYGEKAVLEQRQAELMEMLEKICKERTQKIQSGMTAMEYSAMSLKVQGAEKLIEETRRQIAEVQTRIDVQTAVVIDASKEVKSFENLRDKKLEEYNFEIEKAESERISELISSKLISELNEN